MSDTAVRGSTTGSVRRRAQWLTFGGLLVLGGLLTAAAEAATPPAYAASASITPALYYVGDSAGSTYTVTVKNTGTTSSIGAVEISRPSTGWSIIGCPAPTGWTAQKADPKCRFRSAASASDDIKPGQSKTFTVKATTAPSTANLIGTWKIVVSRSNQFDNTSLLKTASRTGAGLTTTAYTFEVTGAYVAGTIPPIPGTACPTTGTEAIEGSKVTIVVCGKNRATVALRPSLAYSSLAGTFVKTRGEFFTASIPAKSTNRVLATWKDTEVTDEFGPGKKVIAGIGSASNRTSPLRTFSGFSATTTPPQAVADSGTVAEDAVLNVTAPGLLANDTDAEGDPLTAAVVTQPSHGTVTVNADGSYTYTPAADYAGEDSFTYRANDSHTDSAPATVTITVTPVNDAPVATDTSATTPEDTPEEFALPATDVDGDALTYSVVGDPTHGSVTIAGNLASYTPQANYHGNDSFTFKASDGTVDSNVATVAVTVTPVNDVPVADDDAYGTDEDTPLTVPAPGVLTGDSDVEGGTLTAVPGTGPSHGTLTLNPDGSFTYAPTANYHGEDSFTYAASDGDASSAAATVTITVGALNDAPVATPQSVDATEDTPKAITLAGTDVEGSPLTYAIVTGPAHGSLGAIVGSTVTYSPDLNYTGPDSFTFKVSDGTTDSAPATVAIEVGGDNDAPVAMNDAYATNEDTQLVVPAAGVLGNDTDIENHALTAALVTGPAHGTLTLNADGSFTYDPTANYQGADSFTYRANDGLDSNVATVTLTVHQVNDAPTANAFSATTAEDTAKALTLSGSDTEGDTLTYSIVTGPAHGSLGAVTGDSVTYTPDQNYVGSDSFTYKVTDPSLADSAPVTVSLTVTAVNDAPSFTKGADVTVVQDTGAHSAPGWATAISAGPADEAGQTLAFTVTASDPTLFSTQPAISPAGDLTFTPAAGVTGATTVDVTLSDNGGGDDTSGTQTFTITVAPPNATPTADATSGSGNEDGGPITVTLTGHDSDGDALTFLAGTATSGLITVPTGVSCDANTPSTCTATVTYTPNANFNGADSFTYTVHDGTVTSAPATASVTVNPVNDAPSFTKGADQTVNEDAGAQSVSGWGTAISAGPANESAQSVGFEVTDNSNPGLFSAAPAVNSGGTLTYTPAVNANGVATITLRAIDDGGVDNGGVDVSPTQTFTITVGAVNDAPSFTKGADQTLLEDAGAQSVSNWATAISKGPGDESAQTLSFTTSNDNNALFSVQPGVSPTGTLVYTPAPDAVGSATVTISLSDTGGTLNGGDDTSDAQTFTITVGPVNDAPSFTHAGNQTVLEDAGAQSVSGFVTGTSAGPADEAAQTVTTAVTNVTNPGLFSAAPSLANGTLTYTPAANANGVSTVTVSVSDDGGTANGGDDTGSDQTFTITVTPVNDVPSFTKGADQNLDEDAGAQSVSNWATAISQGPANESAQTVSFTVTNTNNALFVTQPAVSPTGTLTYTSAANQYGTATVSVAIVDNGGTANGGDDTSDVQTFTITVNPVNDAPVAAAKAFTVQANMKISLSGLLTGATDPNDVAGDAAWSPTFTVGSITPGAGCVGCTISNVDNAVGTFDFDPPAGGTGTYTVTYTVVDNGYPAPGATSAPQTITFTVNGPVVWFVDADAPAGGTGRLSAPFNNLPAATTAMGSTVNQRIFVEDGNVSGNVTLPTDGWLISDAATGASFDSVMSITPPAGTIARPAVSSGVQRTLTGTVTLGTNSVVRGFNLTPASGSQGLVASGKTGTTVNQMSIATTSARAVNLSNSSGTFSLTRVDANGADRGISLVNTNVSTGSFTITGSGTAGSGGTVTGSTGTAIGEAGIHLNNTKNVSLDRMVVTAGAGNGIWGSTVEALTLANTTVSNNGTNEVNDHSGLNFANLTGTSSISGITVFGSREDNAKIMNSSGSATITVSNSTFRDNNAAVGANGLYMDASGSAAMTVTSTNNTFQRNHTSGLAIFGQSTQRMNVTVTGGSYVTDNGVGLDLETNGPGGMLFNVNGGTVTGCANCAAPVVIYKGTSATGTGSNATAGTLSGMTVTNGGSLNAPGIWVHGEGPGESRLAITNNNVSQVGHYGINVSFGNNGAAPNLGAQTTHVSVTGNTVNHSGVAGSLEGIFVDSGLLSADTTSTCAHISGNNITQPTDDDIRVRNRQAGTSLRLPGYAGGATDHTAVANFLKAQNTVLDAFSGSHASSNGIGGGAACSTP